VPKNGPPFQITAEWKEALAIRMRELGWTHQDLADKVEVTRPAISHLIKRAKESSLLPDIEKAVGWERGPAGGARLALGSRSISRGDVERLRNIVGSPDRLDLLWELVRGLSPDQAELLWYFQRLSPENRARVLERARLLWEDEEREHERKGGKPK
jgi:hypothetical protein